MDTLLDSFVEVTLKEPDDFLLVKESLTRVGVPSRTEKKLFQSCHILHKRGKYYITHFKELFLLDGKVADISQEDIRRRNLIVHLLSDWGLIQVADKEQISEKAPLSSVKVLSFAEKKDYELVAKYTLGKNKKR